MAAQSKPENARARKRITYERVRQLFAYDPSTGILKWRVDRFCANGKGRKIVKAGDEAGSIVKSGTGKCVYRQVRADYILYQVHSIIWLYMTGEFPALVDHHDMDGLNNRFVNLRLADKSKNGANRDAPSNNTSGFKGVYWDKSHSRWAVEIWHEDKKYRLGRFRDLTVAAAVYAAKARELFGEFARTE